MHRQMTILGTEIRFNADIAGFEEQSPSLGGWQSITPVEVMRRIRNTSSLANMSKDDTKVFNLFLDELEKYGLSLFF